MKLFRRSESRRVHVLNSRRKAFLQGGFNRRLHAEKLEDRSLMAADLMTGANAFWNASSPEDVNGDHVVSPNDALIVINALNATGTRSLAMSSGPVAQGEATSGSSAALLTNNYLVDVNNDGAITPLDALSVINRLNKANAEAIPLMQVAVKAVAVGGTFSSPALTTIATGTDYDLVVSVKDLRSGGTGVFNASLDIAFDTTLTSQESEEIQKVDLPANTTGGTFLLSLGGNFTGAITYDTATGDPDTDFATTGRNIQTALNSLLGAGSVAVTYNGLGLPSFVVRFQGAFGDTNVALLGGDGANLTVSSGPTTITTTNNYKSDGSGGFINGDLVGSNPNLFLNSFRFGSKYPNKQNASPGSSQVIPGPFNGFNDAGAFGDSARLGPTERELFRVRMNSSSGGVVTFAASNDNLSIGSENEVYDLNQNLMPSQITLIQAAPLTITQPVDAVNDTYNNVTEGASNVTLSPSPLGNDTKTTVPALTISKVGPSTTSTATTAGGTITISADRLNLIYNPPSSTFNGPDTFTYTITDGTNVDTATGTINVQSFNNAPVVTIPGPQSVAEKATKIFSVGSGNAITVNDVDAGTNGITATLTANQGVLVPGSTPAGVVITGSGTSVLTLTGDQAKINQALDGLQLQPASLTYNGPATLTVAVNDNGFSGGAVSTPKSDSKVLAITVTPVNDPPVNTVPPAQNTTDEDPLVFSTVIGNRFTIADVDAASGTMNVTISVLNGKLVSGGATGGSTITGSGTSSLSIVGTLTQINTFFGSGTITYNSNLNFAGTDTLTILTNDNGNTGAPGAQTDSDTVDIVVVPKVRPKALDDNFTVNETNGATVYSLDVLNGAQGTDRPHDLFASTLLGISSNGTTFGTGNIVTSQGTLSINTRGTAADLTDDTLDFTPNADVFTDVGLPIVFYYKMNDTVPLANANPVRGVDSIGVIRINVTNTPDAPVAVQDGPYAATEDILLTVNAATGVLSNDTDIDYHGTPSLTAVLVTGPTHASAVNGGSFTLNADGSFTYKGDLNYNGPDSFTYKARDPNDPVGLFSNNITVVLNVAADNDAPIGKTHSYSINEDTLLTVGTRATGVLNDATDVETASANLTAELVSGPSNAKAGSFVFNSDGTFTYQGRQDFSGSDSFTFRVVDDNAPTPGKSAITTVNLTVNPVNDAPVAVDDGTALAPIYTVGEGGTLTIAGPGVLGNDTDVDLPVQTLRTALVTTTTNGTLTLNSNGSFTYKPNKVAGQEGFTGIDSFTYRANDGVVNSLNIATVYINVIPFNDPPIANNDPSFSVLEDTLGTFNAVGAKGKGVLVNDTDVDSPTLTAQLVRGPAHALSFTLNSDGSFTYKGALNYNGPDSFTYKASDGASLSNEATVTLNVIADNDAPPVMDDNGPDGQGVVMIKNFVDQPIDVLANDGKNNPDGPEVLTIGSISQSPGHGTATISGGVILYTPTPGYEGPDVLKYLARDPGGLTSEATVTINVVNFRPTDVTGKVYFDTNDNGVKDVAETRALQGVEVQLTGLDFQGVNVVLMATTDLNGNYRFIGLRPGEYTVRELQPEHVVDGKEILVAPQGATLAGNDAYRISLPILGVAGGVNGLNFGEKSVEGMFTGIGDLLSSSGGMLGDGSVGVVLAFDGSGSEWVSILDGWTNLASISISPTTNPNEAILRVTDKAGNSFTKTVYQIVPAGNSSMGRFRVMGNNGGTQMIRLEGTAADFGLNLMAAAGLPQPQGEMGSYAAGVDALMAEQNWA